MPVRVGTSWGAPQASLPCNRAEKSNFFGLRFSHQGVEPFWLLSEYTSMWPVPRKTGGPFHKDAHGKMEAGRAVLALAC